MKKFLPILFIIVTCYMLHVTYIFADFNQAYQDFLYQGNQYRTGLTNYLTAKNRYLTYKTLISQTEALDAAKNFLQARDELITTYLKMLIEKNPGETLTKLLEGEINFYLDHKSKVPSVGSLDDAVSLSQRVSDQFPQTEVLVRKAIADVLLAKLRALEKRQAEIESGLETKINQIKNKGDTATLERWLLATKNKRLLAGQKLNEASGLSDKLKPRSTALLSEDFGQIQIKIFETNQYLKEGAAYLNEITQELKYGNY